MHNSLGDHARGVTIGKRNSGYRAHIYHNRKRHYLGTFDTIVAAARAYDAKAKELFGEFAFLNYPEQNSSPIL